MSGNNEWELGVPMFREALFRSNWQVLHASDTLGVRDAVEASWEAKLGSALSDCEAVHRETLRTFFERPAEFYRSRLPAGFVYTDLSNAGHERLSSFMSIASLIVP